MQKSMSRFSLLLTLFLAATWAHAQDDTTFVVAGTLIDTLNGRAIADPVVEISGDRIVAVSSGGAVPEGANVIDLGDATILPGLADMHTHLTFYDTDFGIDMLAL